MLLNYKKYFCVFLGVFFLILAVIVAFNYRHENTGIFNTDFSRPRGDMNQRFVKVRYLAENPDKYNAFVFGSSRANQLDVEKLDSEFNYYNLSYTGGVPKEWLMDVKTLLKSGVKIKQLILACEDISYTFDINPMLNDLLHVHYQENNISTYVEAVKFKLLHVPDKKWLKDEGCINDIYGYGRFATGEEKLINENPEAHVKSERFNKLANPTKDDNNEEEALDSLRELKQIAEENNIELIVLMNPEYEAQYEEDNFELMLDFKEKLAEITDYYDFCYRSEISNDRLYFYDTSHYSCKVGNMIFDRIFKEEKMKNDGFGKYVTKENIKQHLEFLRKNKESGE